MIQPAITICIDEDDGSVKVAFPSTSYNRRFWGKFHDKIGRQMVEIGSKIFQGKFPNIIVEGTERHIVPIGDVIDHETTKKCKCNPQYYPGTKQILHHPMDGRKVDLKQKSQWQIVDIKV